MIDELKPCPFCGIGIVDTVRKVMGAIRGVWVECLNCHTRSGIYNTEEEAIKAWNRRADK